MSRFEVVDGYNGYYLYDNITGRNVCMGDGVDVPYGRIGTAAFRQTWEDKANENLAEFFAAYFPDLRGLEIYDCPDFIDRYTVILEEATGLEKCLMSCPDLHYCLSLSIDPDSPQGFSQQGYADPECIAQEGDRISFLDLPLNVQTYLARRLER